MTDEPLAHPEDTNDPSLGTQESRADRILRIAIALRQNGVSDAVTRDLLYKYGLDEIEQQLAWLPYRKAKRRAPLLVAAIKGRYGEPVDWSADE